MDLNTVRVLVELAALTAFIGIVAWAWSGARVPDFDAAARLPFDEGQ